MGTIRLKFINREVLFWATEDLKKGEIKNKWAYTWEIQNWMDRVVTGNVLSHKKLKRILGNFECAE